MSRPRLVILGASFGGLELLYRLNRLGETSRREVTIVDRLDRQPYIPLVHEGLSGAQGWEALESEPLASLAERAGARFVQAEVSGLDFDRRVVTTSAGVLEWDGLVVALGSVAEPPPQLVGAGEHAFRQKFPSELRALESRLRAGAGAERRVVVIGGGITGVELAAELADAPWHGGELRVTLVSSTSRLVPGLSPVAGAEVARVLGRLGVEVLSERRVTRVEADRVWLDTGASVESAATVWAGGMRPNPVWGSWGLPCTSDGWIRVDAGLSVEGMGGVYAVGDAARVVEGGAVWPTMLRAIEAIWQAEVLASRLAGRDVRHRLRRDFFHGVSLGRRDSLVVLGERVVNLRAFVGFRRFLQWAYAVRLRYGMRRVTRALPSR